MQHDPEFIRGLVAAWRNAYGYDLTDDQIIDRFDEILNLYVRLRELHHSAPERPEYDRPQQIIPYIVAGDRFLTVTDLDRRSFTVQVPQGYLDEGETLHEAALRIAEETEIGRCRLMAELGVDEQTVDGRTIDRHFYLVEPSASARKRSWIVEHEGGRREYSWMKLAHASDVAGDLGAFLNHLPHAA